MATHVRPASCAKRALFGASMLGGLLAAASALAAPALPTGGHVAAGSASIAGAGGAALTVSQSSAKAIVDWSSFGIGQGGTVQFDNGSGATLNRVTGTGVSSIDGLLSATGSVYLINPNGVIIGKSGVVSTGGSFVASTLDVSNASFLAGGPLTFSGPSTASVINLGKVGSLGGNVGLIAATVRNDGTITAPKGDAGLAAGTTVTLDDTANDAGGLFSVKVGDASTSATNAGAISAAAVELRAQQGNVYALAGNAGGVIDATGVDASGGTIKLISTGGTTQVTGTLSAQGANGAGGQIETSGQQLDIGAASVDTHGGAWLLDPTSLIVNAAAAATIDAALGSGNVTLATNASGPPTGPGVPGDNSGEILIDAPLTWASSTTLTLNSVGDIIVNAPITVAGDGSIALSYASSGLKFILGPTGFVGSISFAPGFSDQRLQINGSFWTLLQTMSDVAGINGSSGNFALAGPLTSTTTYTSAVVASFSGTLDGLGNTISGLTINGGSNGDVGLIGTLGRGGVVRDLGLVGGSVSADQGVGALVGSNQGVIDASYNTGAVSSTNGAFGTVGGLVGENTGVVEASYATGTISGANSAGGLVGFSSGGGVETSYATGAVSGSSYVGGLVGGQEHGTVETSYATGAVAGGATTGGLVGADSAGLIETSHATGTVTGTGASVGGLVGQLLFGTLETSYATGKVTAGKYAGGLVGYIDASTLETSYATGAVSGSNYVGGLVGRSFGNSTIEASYATGAVSSVMEFAGGLVGANGGTIETSYATGAVSGRADIGGLVGDNVAGATISNAYFDTQTAFNSLIGAGVGAGSSTGVTGLTTAQLQSNFGGFMTNLGSAFGGGNGGLFPYLVNFFPSGVQAIVGTATSGGAPAAAGQVGLYSGGVLLGGGTVSTGANGYIYLAVAAGTLGASGDKIGADLTLAGQTAPTVLVYTDAGSPTAGVLNLPALTAFQNAVNTGELTYSGLQTDLGATFGPSVYAGLASEIRQRPMTLTATGASFTLDQPLNTSGLTIQTGAGDGLTIADELALTGSGALDLDAGGALAIDAPINVTGGGQVALTDGAGGLSFGLGQSGFAGSLSFAVGSGEGIAGQALTINGQSYTLLYSMGDLAGLDNGTGRAALVAPLAASGVGVGAFVGVFYGTLEGLGHSISGLSINSFGSYVGLIGELGEGGVLRDIGLSGGSISGVNYVGGLVGYSEAGATIENAITGGATITGSGSDVGGLAGANNGAIAGGRSTDKVDNSGAGDATGGLVGVNGASGSITGGATSSGSVTAIGGVEVGGLVGLNEGAVSSSSAAEQVIDNNHGYAVGGLVGYNAAGASVSGSAANGSILVGDNVRYAGGLAGYNDGAVSNDSSTTTVSAATSLYVGGLVGYNAALGAISSSYASGADVNATGGAAVGGVAGYNGGTIADTYADLSVVLGGPFVGGMVGYNAGDVSTSWSSGEVAGTSASVGGAIGDAAGGTLTNDYWDEGTSGQSHATGLGGSTVGLTAIGGTTGHDPHAQSTYVGFDFTNVWTINPGTSRPFLRNPPPATPPN